MRELKTIQTKENLNRVFAVDEIGPGGANHLYMIKPNENNEKHASSDDFYAHIQLQQGPRCDVKSVHGVIDGDLLEIVRDRLTAFQNGEFACKYNEDALYHVEKALECLNARVEDRIARQVLGTNNK